MRVIQIVAESFNYNDLGNAGFEDLGFKLYRFNGAPVTTSVEGLWAGQTGVGYEKRDSNRAFYGAAALARLVKTRLFSRPFPEWVGVELLDPRSRFTQDPLWHEGSAIEPTSKVWAEFRWFCEHYLPYSDYRHVIYCASLGHVDWRVSGENQGVPTNLQKTWVSFVGAIKETVKMLTADPQNFIVIHPDHGTTRQNQSYNSSMFGTFLWVRDPLNRLDPGVTSTDWAGLRGTLCKALNVASGQIATSGRILM